MSLRAISYGGGVQSTALVVLAGWGVIDFPHAVFANVGDKAEKPATLAYVPIVRAWAAEHGVTIHERRWVTRQGVERDLYDDLMGPGRSIDIPVKMAGGAPGNRKCTDRYKLAVVRRWCVEHGATADDPATVAVGISTDEFERANNRRDEPVERTCYPLLDLGLSRNDCERIIAAAKLPPAPKSACWFCPFQRPLQWAEKRRDQPEEFARAVALEDRLNEKRAALGKDRVYLAVAGVPLAELPEAQPAFDFDGPDTCDSGACWT